MEAAVQTAAAPAPVVPSAFRPKAAAILPGVEAAMQTAAAAPVVQWAFASGSSSSPASSGGSNASSSRSSSGVASLCTTGSNSSPAKKKQISQMGKTTKVAKKVVGFANSSAARGDEYNTPTPGNAESTKREHLETVRGEHR